MINICINITHTLSDLLIGKTFMEFFHFNVKFIKHFSHSLLYLAYEYKKKIMNKLAYEILLCK